MMLTSLIKKGGLTRRMTATPATSATQEAESHTTVAPVATVAVAEKLETVPELLPEQELSIRAWLAHIGESNQALIRELIDQARRQLPERAYLLKRAEEVSAAFDFPTFVTCSRCNHYKRKNHPHLGHCSQSQPEAIAGLWDDDERICDHFSPITN